MHEWVYEKAENLKEEICEKGIDDLTHDNLEEAYYISKVLKNMICIDKDFHIINAMLDNQDKLKDIDKYVNELSIDFKEILRKMDNEEKVKFKTRLQGIMNAM